MITQDDLGKMMALFATKMDLQNLEDRINNRFNQVLDRMDAMVTEVRNYRLEQDGHAQRHSDLEERVRNVEKVPVVAQELKRPKK